MTEADPALNRPLSIAPHFSVHVISEDQLLLLSEQRSFRLTGRLYVTLLPLLDGSRTGEDIVAALAGQESEERLRFAVGNLLRKGYACPVAPDAPAGRQALWAEMGIVPADAEGALAAIAVDVRAIGGAPAEAEAARLLRRALQDSGVPLRRGGNADLTILCVPDYLHRDLAAVNRRMRRASRAWMPFKAGGSLPLLGPLFRPDTAPCWACLADRIIETRPGDNLVDPAVKAVRPALAQTRATRSLATGFAALELARRIAGDHLQDLHEALLSLDLATGERRAHGIRLAPACAICGRPEAPDLALERAMRPLEIRSTPVELQVDGGWRVAPAAQVLERLQRHVSPITGIVDALEDCSPHAGLPVFKATQTNPVPAGPRQNRLIGRPGAAVGKGMGEVQAKVSCLAEAIERYLCGFTGHEPRMRAPWTALGPAAPHPVSFLNFSERQYDEREIWNARHSGFNWVGERFDEARPIEWRPAWSLTHAAPRWLPARFCHFNYVDADCPDPAEDNLFCSADSNGCASGSTLEEAILQGFLELVERDACGMWWYNRLRRPAFDLEVLRNPFVRRVQDFCKAAGRRLHVLDLTNDLGIPTAIALSYREADGGAIVLGLGEASDHQDTDSNE